MIPFAAHAKYGIPGNNIPKNGSSMWELRPTTIMKSMAAAKKAFFGVHYALGVWLEWKSCASPTISCDNYNQPCRK